MKIKSVVVFATSRFLFSMIRNAITSCTNYELKGEASTEDELMHCIECSVPDIVVITGDDTFLKRIKKSTDVKVLMITPVF